MRFFQFADIVSRLGFCIPKDEVGKFKQSFMQNHSCNNESTVTPLFVQLAGDNLDHIVRTLDRKGTLHCLRIISACVLPNGSFGTVCQKVQRVSSRLKVSDVCVYDRVLIINLSRTPAVALGDIKLTFVVLLTLPITLPAVVNLW